MVKFTKGRKAWTVFGWTPGLRRLVQGRVCSCGCLVGLYETSGGRHVEIVDCVGLKCDAGHKNNIVINSSMADETQGAVAPHWGCSR